MSWWNWGIAFEAAKKCVTFTIRDLKTGENVYFVNLPLNASSPLTFCKHFHLVDDVFALDEGDFSKTVQCLSKNGIVIPQEIKPYLNR